MAPNNTTQSANVDTDTVYIPEALIADRSRKGKVEYLVRWKGYTAVHDTWEPASSFEQSDIYIDAYEKLKNRRTGAQLKVIRGKHCRLVPVMTRLYQIDAKFIAK